jgi:hypothetical protein
MDNSQATRSSHFRAEFLQETLKIVAAVHGSIENDQRPLCRRNIKTFQFIRTFN